MRVHVPGVSDIGSGFGSKVVDDGSGIGGNVVSDDSYAGRRIGGIG